MEETVDVWCENCLSSKRELEDLKSQKEFSLKNLHTLKAKVVATDLLIKDFAAKSKELDLHIKKKKELSTLVEQINKECRIKSDELSFALRDREVLHKANENLAEENMKCAERISKLETDMLAAKTMQVQYQEKLKQMETEEAAKDRSIEQLKKQLQSEKKEATAMGKSAEEMKKCLLEKKAEERVFVKKTAQTKTHILQLSRILKNHSLLTGRSLQIYKRYTEITEENSLSGNSDIEADGEKLELLLTGNDSRTRKIDVEAQTEEVLDKPDVNWEIDLLLDMIPSLFIVPGCLRPLSPIPKSPERSKKLGKSKEIAVVARKETICPDPPENDSDIQMEITQPTKEPLSRGVEVIVPQRFEDNAQSRDNMTVREDKMDTTVKFSDIIIVDCDDKMVDKPTPDFENQLADNASSQIDKGSKERLNVTVVSDQSSAYRTLGLKGKQPAVSFLKAGRVARPKLRSTSASSGRVTFRKMSQIAIERLLPEVFKCPGQIQDFWEEETTAVRKLKRLKKKKTQEREIVRGKRKRFETEDVRKDLRMIQSVPSPLSSLKTPPPKTDLRGDCGTVPPVISGQATVNARVDFKRPDLHGDCGTVPPVISGRGSTVDARVDFKRPRTSNVTWKRLDQCFVAESKITDGVSTMDSNCPKQPTSNAISDKSTVTDTNPQVPIPKDRKESGGFPGPMIRKSMKTSGTRHPTIPARYNQKQMLIEPNQKTTTVDSRKLLVSQTVPSESSRVTVNREQRCPLPAKDRELSDTSSGENTWETPSYDQLPKTVPTVDPGKLDQSETFDYTTSVPRKQWISRVGTSKTAQVNVTDVKRLSVPSVVDLEPSKDLSVVDTVEKPAAKEPVIEPMELEQPAGITSTEDAEQSGACSGIGPSDTMEREEPQELVEMDPVWDHGDADGSKCPEKDLVWNALSDNWYLQNQDVEPVETGHGVDKAWELVTLLKKAQLGKDQCWKTIRTRYEEHFSAGTAGQFARCVVQNMWSPKLVPKDSITKGLFVPYILQKRLMRLIDELREGPKAEEFERELAKEIWRDVMTRDGPQLPRALALCWVFVKLCCKREEPQMVRVLCHDVLQLFPDKGLLIVANAVKAWPEAFGQSNGGCGPLRHVIGWLFSSKIDLSGFDEETKNRISQVFPPSTQTVDELTRELVEGFNQTISGCMRLVETVQALQILAAHNGWPWANDVLIRHRLWPLLQAWSQSSAADRPKDHTAANVIYLIGCLTKFGATDNDQATEVIQTMKALLAKASSTTVADCVQEAAVLVLLILKPFDSASSTAALESWWQAKPTCELSDRTVTLLRAVRLT